jgi:ABC-type sugar transport system ATPase subunit
VTATTPLLSITGLTKSFGPTVVLDHVDISLKRGEVRALLGENGAGKSTLIKILAGIHQSDSGNIVINGSEKKFDSPRDSFLAGIATVHQEIMVSPGLSVAENVLLGSATPSNFGKVNWRRINKIAQEFFQELGQELDVSKPVENLSPIQMTMTALARSLCQNAQILILDEPTAALTDSEVQQLFAVIKRLSDRGVSILYVSHRLAEVFQIADTYTVLRNGHKVAEGLVSETTITEIITSMSGKNIEQIFPPRSKETAKEILAVSDLAGKKVRGINFTVHEGETLGIAGLAGSGRSEILRIISGAQKIVSGKMTLKGAAYDPKSSQEAHGKGVVFVPQDRAHSGLIPGSILSNIVVTKLSQLTKLRIFSSRKQETEAGKRAWKEMDIRGSSLAQEIFTLSGGNQQKVVLAKFLALSPTLLLIDEPTKGVDVATRSEIYRLIAALTARGMSVVVVSSELSELMAISHRMIVLHEGQQVGTFVCDDITENQALLASYGRTG